MRTAGVSYAEIGAKLGISAQGAHETVMRGLKAIVSEPAEELRTLELERIDRMLTTVWANATEAKAFDPDTGVALATDMQSLQAIVHAQAATIKLMERRAKLLGIDAPIAQTFTGTLKQISAEPMTPAEWAAKHSGEGES